MIFRNHHNKNLKLPMQHSKIFNRKGFALMPIAIAFKSTDAEMTKDY